MSNLRSKLWDAVWSGAGLCDEECERIVSNVETVIDDAVAAEREACAEICDALRSSFEELAAAEMQEQSVLISEVAYRNKAYGAKDCASKIRSRKGV